MAGLRGMSSTDIALLVGAGISRPLPSALPDAFEFISALTERITTDRGLQEVIRERAFQARSPRRYQGDYLRFETIMHLIENGVDPEMRVLRAYSDSTVPNSYHLFLAEQIRQGSVVLTTNFDNLIEAACRAVGISYSLIVTDDELTRFGADPGSPESPLIKLHGGYDLCDADGTKRAGALNVKASLGAVGRVFLGRRSDASSRAIAAVLRARHLIVVGYSGCDDFDIMPALLNAKPAHGFTWIDHCDQPAEVFRDGKASESDRPPFAMLAEHAGCPNTEVVRGRTADILGVRSAQTRAQGPYAWKRAFDAWAREHLGSEDQKRLLLGQILSSIGLSEEGASILQEVRRERLTEREWVCRCAALSDLFVALGDHDRAIRNLAELVDLDGEAAGASVQAVAHYDLARINTDKGQYHEAKMYLASALKAFMDLGNKACIGNCLHERGRIELGTGATEKAIESFKLGTKISREVGDLSGTGVGFTEISRAFSDLGRGKDAEDYARRAIHVLERLCNCEQLGRAHHALGFALSMGGDWKAAEREFEIAVRYERTAGDTLDVAHSYHCLGHTHLMVKAFDRARRFLHESIRIKESLRDEEGVGRSRYLLDVISRMAARDAD